MVRVDADSAQTGESHPTVGSLVVTLRTSPHASCAIVCFPWAGAGVAAFFPWLKLVPDSLDISVVRLPGRESRIAEAPFRSLTEAAKAIAQALAPTLLKRTVFFGHSLGALLAFETAQELEGQQRSILDALVVSGANDPSAPHGGHLHQLEDDHLRKAVARMSGDAETGQLSPSIQPMILRPLRADCEMAETYVSRRRPPLSTPILAYLGNADSSIDATTIWRWGLCSRAGAQVRWFDGGHFFLRDHPAPVVEQLVADVRTQQQQRSR